MMMMVGDRGHVVTPGHHRDEGQRPAEPRDDGHSRVGPTAGGQAFTMEERTIVRKPQEVLAVLYLYNLILE